MRDTPLQDGSAAGDATPVNRPPLASATTEVQSRSDIYKWQVLATVMIGIFMIILDATVVNVAFRTLQQEFGGNLADAQWVLSIYVLALGVTTPMSGFLGDRFGIKRVYLLGLALFVIGSLLCGLAPTLGLLIAMRALQGVGGGIAQPLGPAMIYRTFPPKEQGLALGIFGIVLVVGPALGPILGGLLVDANVWRFIFFINVPIGIVGVAFGYRVLRFGAAERRPKLDPLGLILSIIAFGSLLYAATSAESNGWTAAPTLFAFGVGIAGMIAFAIVELFVAKEPLLDLRLFKNPVFLNATVIGYVTVLALFGAEFLMPLYLQLLRGLTAFETGILLLALAAASGITTPLAGRLYDKIGPRALVTTGFALLVINTWQLAQLQADTPFTTLALLLALRGLALGLTVQSTFTTALGAVPLPQLPRGSSLLNSTRFVVQAIAVALLATILSGALSPMVKQFQDRVQQASGQAGALAGAQQQVNVSARFGLCETPNVAPQNNIPPGTSQRVQRLPADQQAAARQQVLSGVQAACHDYISGFEQAYRLTFIFSIVSLVLGLFLPGWPGKWAGRGAYQQAQPAGASAGAH